MMKGLPEKACVHMTEKGKTKEMYIKIESDKVGYLLYVSDSPNALILKTNYPLKRVYVELKASDPTGCTLLFITPTQEITFVFKTKEAAESYYKFISEKSDVHSENAAISQLDEEMRAIWPFPGGSFF